MGDEKQPPAPPPLPLPGEGAVEYLRRTTAPLGTPIVPRIPTPTAETRTLGPEGKQVVQRARAWAQALGILVAALAAAIPLLVGAYRSAVEEARVRAQAAAKEAKVETQRVKNESEAGYQLSRPLVEEHERRLAALELRCPPAPPHQRRGGRPRPAPPPAPKVLPADLAQALKAVTRGAPAAGTTPAAGPAPVISDAGVTAR